MQNTLRDAPEAEDRSFADTEPAQVPIDAWTWAALAHASVLLTLVLGMAGGIGALIGPVIPLAMYFGYRGKSRFAALHALQSFVYQAVGIVIYVLLIAAAAALVSVAWMVSGLLSAVLVGFLLMPIALLLTLLVAFPLICIPFVWLGYGLYAAYRVYQGRDFRYWLIGEWLEREVTS